MVSLFRVTSTATDTGLIKTRASSSFGKSFRDVRNSHARSTFGKLFLTLRSRRAKHSRATIYKVESKRSAQSTFEKFVQSGDSRGCGKYFYGVVTREMKMRGRRIFFQGGNIENENSFIGI